MPAIVRLWGSAHDRVTAVHRGGKPVNGKYRDGEHEQATRNRGQRRDAATGLGGGAMPGDETDDEAYEAEDERCDRQQEQEDAPDQASNDPHRYRPAKQRGEDQRQADPNRTLDSP